MSNEEMKKNIKTKDKHELRRKIIKDMAVVALFFALLTVSTFIRIPLPFGNYLTLQLEVVILIGFILGPKLALITTGLYVFVGLMGIPIFAAGGGISYIFLPSFGYIYGFIISSFFVGLLSNKTKNMNVLKSIGISLLGIAIIYIFGYLHQYIIYNFYYENQPLALKEIILSTMAFAVPKDLILGVLCGLISVRLKKIYQKIYNH